MSIPLDASKHLIKAVTIFSSRKAEVIRTFTVELAEGQNELIISALPSCIDIDSARLTGLGDAILFDVVCTVVDARDMPPSAQDDTLKALERRKQILDGEKSLRGQAADIMVQYGRTMSSEFARVDTVNEFLESLVQRGSTTLTEASEIEAQLAELEKEIEKEKRKLQKERQKAAARGRVSAVIMAKRPGKIEITLTYMVSNATWSPSYDLRASTEEGKPTGTVSLHYRASIQQNTGEDWRDTAVSVSTATPGTWTTIPPLRSMKIAPGTLEHVATKKAHVEKSTARFGGYAQQQQQNVGSNMQPNVRAQMSRMNNNVPAFGFGPTQSAVVAAPMQTMGTAPIPPPPPGAATFQSDVARGTDDWTAVDVANAVEDAGSSDDENDAAWTETKAIVTESAVASSFRIEGKCTIPSEPTAHRVAIALLAFDAKVNYIAVPRSAPIAFLQCEVKNTSEYRLLPGSVNVFLDNSPVSKTFINDVNPEEIFKCMLGPDPTLRIKCTRLPRTVTSSGSAYAAQTTITTYKISTSVSNAHSFAIKGLQIRDAAPDAGQTTEHSSVPGIKVVIKRPEGLGEATPNALVDVKTSIKSETCSVKVRWAGGGSEKEGKYMWLVDVGAGEEVKLEAEYEVRAPGDYVWQLREDYFQ